MELQFKILQQGSVIKDGYTMSDVDKEKIEEFKNLVKNLKAQNVLYEDPDFPADNGSLGSSVCNKAK